jgi:hypothetical protein
MKSKLAVLLLCLLVIISTALLACTSAPAASVKPSDSAKPAVTEKPVEAAKPAAKALYSPKDVDDARHTDSDLMYEWWYLDAAFDNGYSMSMSFQLMDSRFVTTPGRTKAIEFAIYDPSGKKTGVFDEFDIKDVSASTTSCDVTMGSNRVKGSIPRYDLEFHSKDLSKGLGCKLTFENTDEGFRQPPNGVYYFSEQPKRYIGWVIAQPRAKVTGTIIVDGKEMPVTGVGYHDHNWGNCKLTEMYKYWYWGRILLPDYTIIYSAGQKSDAVGGGPTNALLALKGGKLVDMSSDISAEPSDFIVDPVTNTPYPQKLILRSDGRAVKGTVIHKLNYLVESYLPWGETEGKTHGYFRFLSDCDIDLNLSGEKVQQKTQLIHELMMP